MYNTNATFSTPYMDPLILYQFSQAMEPRDTYNDFLPRHHLLRLRRAGIIPVRL
jgi:hypothetical protein